MKSDLIYDREVRNTGDRIPCPPPSMGSNHGTDQAGEEHNEISGHPNQQTGTTETRQKRQTDESQRRCQDPIYVSSPVYLTVDQFWCRRGPMLVGSEMNPGHPIPGGHGKVSKEGNCSHEGDQDMEHPLLL